MEVPSLRIGRHECEFPIIQGGMGVGVSLHGLASSVAKEGGVGVIAGAAIGFLREGFAENPYKANIEAVKEEIARAREISPGGIIGINIMVALNDYEGIVRASLEANVDVIFSGAGLPLSLPKIKKEYKKNITALVPIISSPRAANIICKKWIRQGYIPDGVVLEGPDAGGHLGFSLEELQGGAIKMEKLVLDTLKVLSSVEAETGQKIPLIVAGGVYTGEDIGRLLKLGVSGVQMATRFVTTEECDAHIAFKEEYLRAKKEDIVFIKSPVGLPGRAIRNKFLEAVERGEKRPFKCPYHCIKTCRPKKAPYCISLALINAQQGRLEKGFAFAGANAYKAEKITTVRDLMRELVDGVSTYRS